MTLTRHENGAGATPTCGRRRRRRRADQLRSAAAASAKCRRRGGGGAQLYYELRTEMKNIDSIDRAYNYGRKS